MSGARKVLIIDDEDDIRELARISLERVGGLKVVTASSGREGIEAAAAQSPDAIVLDARMPGLDGPDTLAELKASPATKSIPVVFLTGSVQPTQAEHFKSLGAAGTITKPFDPMQLPARLKACLGWDED